MLPNTAIVFFDDEEYSHLSGCVYMSKITNIGVKKIHRKKLEALDSNRVLSGVQCYCGNVDYRGLSFL